ncbi:MAG: RNA polymerase subunit sigma-70 [Deltaproteobacteria bacterium]|nr:RNA polymerase subunit sigma-70 [Deltaproteobacteria bacterium]
MSNSGTVTRLICQARNGDERAANELWNVYFHRLTGIARKRLPAGKRRAVDEEDIALNALASFFRGARGGRFSRLNNRDDLWRLLVQITSNKAAHHLEREAAQKRGGGRVRGESVLQARAGQTDSAADLGAQRPFPVVLDAQDEQAASEFAVALNDECERLLDLLGNKNEPRVAELRKIAVWKLKGHTNAEIAKKLCRGATTVDRKVRLIRDRWLHENIS